MAQETLLPPDAVRTRPPTPSIPGIENHGQASNELVHLRNKWLHEQKIRGLLQPATLLNLGPFSLQVTAPIDFRIPPCPHDKDFAVYVRRNAITLAKYMGAREQHDQSIRHIREIKGILPAEQLMEFKRAYSMDGGQEGVAYGGLVIFEGDPKAIGIDSDTIVKTPYYEQVGADRYLMFREELLGDLIEGADAELKMKAMNMLRDGQSYADGNEDQRRNLTPDFHVWADFALRKKWISKLPAWRTAEATSITELCQKCGDRYVSQTGVCKCGYVRDPVKAYEVSEIGLDHVRMASLSADQWKRVKEVEAARKSARGEE